MSTIGGFKSFNRSAVQTLIRHGVVAILQLAVAVTIARRYGAEVNGLFALSVLLPTLMVTLTKFGIPVSTVYFLGREQISEQKILGLLAVGWIATTMFGIVAGIVLIFYREIFFNGVDQVLLWIGLTTFPLTLAHLFCAGYMHAKRDFSAYNSLLLSHPILFAVFVMVLWMVGSSSLLHLLWVYLASTLITFAFSIYLVAKNHYSQWADKDFSFGEKSTWSDFRKLYSFGIRSHLSDILTFVNYRIDYFLVNFFLGAAQTGIYVVAVAGGGKNLDGVPIHFNSAVPEPCKNE